MTTPGIAAGRFLGGIAVGIVLGAWYGFLRPLGRRRRNTADFLFLVLLFPAWVYFSFAICDGDLRPGYWLSLFLGGWLFDRTIGRLLHPIWAQFWRAIGWIYGNVKKFFRKIKNFCKKIFTYLRKLSTMILYEHLHTKTRTGGKNRDRTRNKEKRSAGVQAQQQADQGGSVRGNRIVYGDPTGVTFGDA